MPSHPARPGVSAAAARHLGILHRAGLLARTRVHRRVLCRQSGRAGRMIS